MDIFRKLFNKKKTLRILPQPTKPVDYHVSRDIYWINRREEIWSVTNYYIPSRIKKNVSNNIIKFKIKKIKI